GHASRYRSGVPVVCRRGSPMSDFFVGVDLGQSRDFTAIAVVERGEHVTDAAAPLRRRPYILTGAPSAATAAAPVKLYDVRHCGRPRLGTPYPDVVRRVCDLLGRLGTGATLVVDATGVGRPVVDLFEAAHVYPIAVTLTGGAGFAESGRSCRVPKRDLVAT